ncbi:PD-(D/E)XK nuclease family protein [Treponema sp.]|uniref:PD-(D/E)XK nuclease family protein n=1 Tax=Treponema sp. TaxID=166 RepID=UPI0025D6F4C6|nr:PD-(D/E)XK nuclease family protein [Treponema sp.]MCR5218537.1 PD-(D/E)XK nuclease family protein [Treponema sp.]
MEENNLIQKTIEENIKNINSVFIFPTQNAADLWADRTVKYSQVKAVASERFIAWDRFKGTSIRSQNQNKTSIPSTMRQIFAKILIEKNAESPFLKNLITPEYAGSASGFYKWFASILPGLATWKRQFDLKKISPDDEDSDLLELYKRYSDFLNTYNLFDPAWETPPFKKDGNTYILFFPEILSDWFEYKTILESTEEIKLIHMDNNSYKDAKVKMFNNSRTELTNIALKIRELHEEKNIPWSEIAVSVPDLDNYGPYIKREFELYQIPHVLKMAAPLSDSSAGSFFSMAEECVNSDFTYESIKNLLLNTQLPWKEGLPVNRFIAYGQNNHCICSYEYKNKKIDVWKQSLKQNYDKEVETFYNDFSGQLKKLVESKSFSQIRDNYFIFRNTFFNMEECPEESDRIISRCISELGSLIDLETVFPECMVKNPYSFFVSYLSDTKYLAQNKNNGVSILPYKTAASSPFDCHIIIDSSQRGLSVIYKELPFLTDEKRKILFGTDYQDSNTSEEFIQLYAMNSLKEEPYFTCSSKTFTDYAQSSSYLIPEDLTKCSDDKILHNKDTYYEENQWLINQTAFPEKITQLQKDGQDFWYDCQLSEDSAVPEETIKKIQDAVNKKRLKDSYVCISPTVLNHFFDCPRKWLFYSVSNLDEENTEAELVKNTELGDLYHRVFELYCRQLKFKNLLILYEENSIPEEHKKILQQAIKDAIEESKKSFLTGELLSATENSLTELLVKSVSTFSQTFNGCKVIATEERYSFADKEKNILFEGRIDCLLMDPEAEEYILVDFKSKNIPGNKYLDPEDNPASPLEEQNLPDFQMPFYIYLLRKQTPAVNIENCCFYNVQKSEADPVAGISIYQRKNKRNTVSPEDFEKVIDKMVECTNRYAERIRDNNFSVNNTAQDFNTCSSCHYKAICRRTFTVSRKN